MNKSLKKYLKENKSDLQLLFHDVTINSLQEVSNPVIKFITINYHEKATFRPVTYLNKPISKI
jgi:hypothetical protein